MMEKNEGRKEQENENRKDVKEIIRDKRAPGDRYENYDVATYSDQCEKINKIAMTENEWFETEPEKKDSKQNNIDTKHTGIISNEKEDLGSIGKNQNYILNAPNIKGNVNITRKSNELFEVRTIYNSIPSPSDNTLISNQITTTCTDVKTLEDALKYFGLFSHVEELDESLEDARRHRKSKEDHELYLKQFDKKMQKLSLEYHPDRVKHKKGSSEEMAIAQKLQSTLNATRKVFSHLTKTFLEDLYVDHKYSFCLKLNINSVGNEEEIESYVSGVLFKISFISSIKKHKIIPEIRKFLIESRSCIKSYIDSNDFEFERYYHSAVYQLKTCIKGYEKLLKEYEAVQGECKEENMENISSLIQKMKADSSGQLKSLKQLNEIVNNSVKGIFKIFIFSNALDGYFVRPFVCYMNLIIMCNAMTKTGKESFLRRMWREILYSSHVLYEPAIMQHYEMFPFLVSYYLASYYIGNNDFKSVVRNIMGKENANKKEIKEKFLSHVMEINEYLEGKFKIDDYNVRGTNRHVTEELNICTRMVDSFEGKPKELSKGIREFKSDTQAMKAECVQIRKGDEEFSGNLGEGLEDSRKLRETFIVSITKEFEVGDYNEKSIKSNSIEEPDNCAKMMASFEKKANKLSKDIGELKRGYQEVKEKCGQIKKEHEEFYEKVKENLEHSSKLTETRSTSFNKISYGN